MASHYSKSCCLSSALSVRLVCVISMQGAAWDLNFVAEGEPLSLALAQAFAEVKIAKVMSVLRVCELCVCGESGPDCHQTQDVALLDCGGPAPGIKELSFTNHTTSSVALFPFH